MTVVSSTLPAVVQVQPANGATSVPENGRVVVRLAQAVQSSVIVAGTLTLSQGSTSITGTVTLSNDGLSITFAPSQNLAASTSYSVAVTNVAGGQTSPEFQSTFTTGSTTDTTNPQIVLTSPQSGNSNIPTSAPIVAQFTKPMDPATLTPQNFTVYDDTAGVYLAATVEVAATGTIATFVPQQPLGVGRQFQVYLSPSVEDTSGNSLTGSGIEFGFTTSFSPDTTQPQVAGISPFNGATNVPTNGLIVLGFSKPIDPISLTNGFQVQSGGQPVAGGVAMSNGNELLTFTPTGGLTASATYNVTVTSQVTDIGGLALSNPATYSFVTGTTTNTNTPKVSVASPVSYATGVPTNSQIQLEFSEPIDPLTVTSTTFELIPIGYEYVCAGDNRGFFQRPDCDVHTYDSFLSVGFLPRDRKQRHYRRCRQPAAILRNLLLHRPEFRYDLADGDAGESGERGNWNAGQHSRRCQREHCFEWDQCGKRNGHALRGWSLGTRHGQPEQQRNDAQLRFNVSSVAEHNLHGERQWCDRRSRQPDHSIHQYLHHRHFEHCQHNHAGRREYEPGRLHHGSFRQQPHRADFQ
jgi:hypothetical protein